MNACAKEEGNSIHECTRPVHDCQCARGLVVLAKRIAYPKRGSADENKSVQDFADEIQSNYSVISL